jgi:hypothetical protein
MNILTIKTAAVFVASALLCLPATAPVFAQDQPGAATARGDVPELLKQATAQLTELEQAVQSIEQSGVIPAETLTTYNDVLTTYTETMHRATDGALSAASLAAKTNGKQGSVQTLVLFENTAKDHEKRTAALQARLEKISGGVRSGTLKTTAVGAGLRALLDGLNKPIVAPAEAALAIGALGPCIAQAWVACAIAIVKATAQAVSAWNSYQSCLANLPPVPTKPSPPSSSPWWSYAIRKAAYNAALAVYEVKMAAYTYHRQICTAVFVAKIA